MGVLTTVVETIRGMDEIQASKVTLHFHLSMQGVVMDSLAWPYSDVGNGAEIRAETQKRLKAVYVDPILEAAKLTARAPIININHHPRFIAIASNALPCPPPLEGCERSRNSIPSYGILCGIGTTCAWMCGNSWIVLLVQNGMSLENLR